MQNFTQIFILRCDPIKQVLKSTFKKVYSLVCKLQLMMNLISDYTGSSETFSETSIFAIIL